MVTPHSQIMAVINQVSQDLNSAQAEFEYRKQVKEQEWRAGSSSGDPVTASSRAHLEDVVMRGVVDEEPMPAEVCERRSGAERDGVQWPEPSNRIHPSRLRVPGLILGHITHTDRLCIHCTGGKSLRW